MKRLIRFRLEMSLPELIEYVKSGGGIISPLLLLALIWMNGERKDAVSKADDANLKLADLSERTMVLLTEIKFLFGQNK